MNKSLQLEFDKIFKWKVYGSLQVHLSLFGSAGLINPIRTIIASVLWFMEDTFWNSACGDHDGAWYGNFNLEIEATA